jgi:hypothetical protein
MMLHTLLALAVAGLPQAFDGDTTSVQPQVLNMWRADAAMYAPCFDRVHQRWLITMDGANGPMIFATSGFSTPPAQMRVQESAAARGLGCITISESGEAYGVAYFMGARQRYATIVRVFLEENAIVIGDPLESVRSESYASFPTISPDGSRIVFSSNRLGTVGQTDLWYVERLSDNSWSTPQHCGGSINSPLAETTPHFVANDTLLFSSDGFGGQGGMDVFLSVYRNGAWQDPVPVEQVNSHLNETDAVVTRDGDMIFVRNTSEQQGASVLWLLPHVGRERP